MNLSSILLKSIITSGDMDAWAECEQHYFSSEFHPIWKFLNKYVEEYSSLPSFQAIGLSVRDESLREKFIGLENVETTDIDNVTLVGYLKNEYTQREIMSQLDKYLEHTIAIESAEDSIEALQNIVLDLESKVNLQDPAENMQTMELVPSEDEIERSTILTLNEDYDGRQRFASSDYILIGGRRGSGKSVTCANIATNIFSQGHSVMYFTIEMTSQAIMQRCAAIATGVPAAAIRNRNLSMNEWIKLAKWWSNRFEDSDDVLSDYMEHKDFSEFHTKLKKKPLKQAQLDIIYNPTLSLANIRTHLDKKVKKLQPKVVIVDYLNQVKRGTVNNRMGQYDWTEQIEVSKALKTFAQEYDVLMVSPYQTDATGEARFAKGILDSADAAYTLDTHSHEDNIITFNCTKMRNSDEESFTSVMDWTSLKIGPETGHLKDKVEEEPTEDLW
ncbi:MAG: DnaB-like helicase C-terminal domain-containing protein [Burkholderiaceae bacterium]